MRRGWGIFGENTFDEEKGLLRGRFSDDDDDDNVADLRIPWILKTSIILNYTEYYPNLERWKSSV
ncbi:hypothetical protein AJ78_08904 [Emergomyces pasteurianus Ep9510]|uniref:Uncharacterized protein n=1 Tax=Emergomyces pasteurianus Ep9510 TaxID=1447872 RepID=A0A1J9P0T7_9EURO|nr:hypothetical protein AJ78_08904 [Emergomyces pasteurianus Ep9510]